MAALREVAFLLALAAGCTPMTFSNEQSVDFASYPSVSVELGGSRITIAGSSGLRVWALTR